MTLHNSAIRDSAGDKAFNVLNYIFAAASFLLVLYPLVFVLSSSFSSPEAIVSGRVWILPVQPGLEGYKAVFQDSDVWLGYFNSFFYTIVGTAFNVFMTIAAAYPLSRRDFRGRNFIMMAFTFTMIFSGGMIPTYILIRNLHIMNTRWAMILPSAMSVYNVIIARTYFISNIPNEMLEAAKIDGCSDFKFITSVVVPLSGAIIAVIALFSAAGYWNNYFDALLYLSSKRLYPLQIFLRDIMLANNSSSNDIAMDIHDQTKSLYLDELLKYSLVIVASVPMLIIYPFIQKYFVKGVMIGSIKG